MDAVDAPRITIFLPPDFITDMSEVFELWGQSLVPSCSIQCEPDTAALTSISSDQAFVFVGSPIFDLAGAMQDGKSPSRALEEWEARTRTLLADIAEGASGRQLMLLDAHALRRQPGAMLERLEAHVRGHTRAKAFRPVFEETPFEPFFLLVAQCLLQSQPQASSLYDALAGRVDQGFHPLNLDLTVLDDLVEERSQKYRDAQEKTLLAAVIGQLHGELENFGAEVVVWKSASDAANVRTEMIQARARLREGALAAALLENGLRLDTLRGQREETTGLTGEDL